MCLETMAAKRLHAKHALKEAGDVVAWTIVFLTCVVEMVVGYIARSKCGCACGGVHVSYSVVGRCSGCSNIVTRAGASADCGQVVHVVVVLLCSW